MKMAGICATIFKNREYTFVHQAVQATWPILKRLRRYAFVYNVTKKPWLITYI